MRATATTLCKKGLYIGYIGIYKVLGLGKNMESILIVLYRV